MGVGGCGWLGVGVLFSGRREDGAEARAEAVDLFLRDAAVGERGLEVGMVQHLLDGELGGVAVRVALYHMVGKCLAQAVGTDVARYAAGSGGLFDQVVEHLDRDRLRRACLAVAVARDEQRIVEAVAILARGKVVGEHLPDLRRDSRIVELARLRLDQIAVGFEGAVRIDHVMDLERQQVVGAQAKQDADREDRVVAYLAAAEIVVLHGVDIVC